MSIIFGFANHSYSLFLQSGEFGCHMSPYKNTIIYFRLNECHVYFT